MTVQHFVSMEPDTHAVTAARLVQCGKTEDVSLFTGEVMLGVVHVARGDGLKLIEQLQLIERSLAVSFDDIVREFNLAKQATE